jgi:hypothetical protein
MTVEPLFTQQYGGLGEQQGLIVPFLACGDLRGYDADQNYPLLLPHQLPITAPQPMSELGRADPTDGGDGGDGEDRQMAGAEGTGFTYTYREPTQKPTHPAYRAALEEQARRDQRKLCFSSGVGSAACALSAGAGGAAAGAVALHGATGGTGVETAAPAAPPS